MGDENGGGDADGRTGTGGSVDSDGQSTEDGLPDGETVLAQFVDLHGVPRGTCVPADHWETVREGGVGFASLIMDVYETRTGRGLVPDVTYDSASAEISAVPVPSTAVPIPWTDDGSTVVQCSVERAGEPFALCSRGTLSAALADLADLGLSARVGTELEFTLLADGALPSAGVSGSGDDADHGRTGDREAVDGETVDGAATVPPRPYDVRSLVSVSPYVSDLVSALETMGVGVEGIHREGSPGQFEASLVHDDPLAAADAVVLARQAVRGVGRPHGYGATFMPYPSPEYEGSGLHVHLSLWDDGENVCVGEAELGLSETAAQFVAGVLEHADALAAVCAPTVNSYKRFQPGTFAPVDRTYGFDNRSALVRVPPSSEADTRLEVRLPDSYANPYLALAGILAAGTDGIRSESSPPPPADSDRYSADDDAPPLPATLGDALDALEADDVLCEALGEPLVAQFCKLKRDELRRFHGTITDWEVDEYVDRL